MNPKVNVTNQGILADSRLLPLYSGAVNFSPAETFKDYPDAEVIHILEKETLIYCYMGMQTVCLKEKTR